MERVHALTAEFTVPPPPPGTLARGVPQILVIILCFRPVDLHLFLKDLVTLPLQLD